MSVNISTQAVSTNLKAVNNSSPSLFLGRRAFKPKKIDLEKALQTCLLQAGITPGEEFNILLFVSSDENVDFGKLRRGLFLKKLNLSPIQSSAFWRFLEGQSTDSFGVALLGGPLGVMNLRSSTVLSYQRYFPTVIENLKISLFESMQTTLRERSESLLMQEKAGRFGFLESPLKTKRELKKFLLEKPDAEVFSSFGLSHSDFLLGWGVGALRFEKNGDEGFRTASLGIGKEISEWSYLNSLAITFSEWLLGLDVETKDCQYYWVISSCSILSAIFGELLVRNLDISWEQLVFPDIVYGLNPVGSSLLFLRRAISPRAMILLENDDEIRFAFVPGYK